VKPTGLRVTLEYFTSILILSEGCTDCDGKVDIETMDSRCRHSFSLSHTHTHTHTHT
jgi:hypothetical protein